MDEDELKGFGMDSLQTIGRDSNSGKCVKEEVPARCGEFISCYPFKYNQRFGESHAPKLINSTAARNIIVVSPNRRSARYNKFANFSDQFMGTPPPTHKWAVVRPPPPGPPRFQIPTNKVICAFSWKTYDFFRFRAPRP